MFAECANAYGDDAYCTFQALKGQCVNDSAFMMKYCQKACSRCEPDAIGMYIVISFLARDSIMLYQTKSNQITLLAMAPLIRNTGAPVQAYNYNANTIPINNKSKKT